jgi:4-amino-4-deoxy-L-arabinose transferase-like glycosyltransferase
MPRLRPRTLAVAAILILAVALRVGEIQRVAYTPIYDAGSYLTLARQIVVNGDYSPSTMSGNGAGRTRGPSAYFPPGFPYYLALFDVLDDAPTAAPLPGQAAHFSATTVQVARYAELIPETLTVALIGLIALECFGEAVALAALVLAAIDPVLIELTGTIVAENLFTALVLSAVWALLRARSAAGEARALGWTAAAGVLIGLSSLTHLNGVLVILPGLFAVARPLRAGARRASPRALAAPALLVAAAALTILPWTVRNAVELHSFVPISDEAGMTLVGTYNAASAHNPQLPYKWRYFAAIPGEHHLFRAARQMTETALMSRLQHQALDYIGAHPTALLSAGADNLLRMLELEGSYAWRASALAIGLDPATAHAGVIGFWVIALLALLGLLAPEVRRAPRWLWAVPILLTLSIVLVNVETPRFREPIEPFLILLAACLLGRLPTRAWRLRRRRPRGHVGAPA